MNPSWKFKFAICLLSLYIVGINCLPAVSLQSEDEDGDKGMVTFKI